MDVKEYIKSGILENYVFNLVNDQEKREVECLRRIYPEIDLELKQLFSNIEELATKQAISPNPNLKDKILQSIKNTPQEDISIDENKSIEDPKIIPIKQFSILKIAASIVLLCSIVLSTYLFQKNRTSQMALTQSQNDLTVLKTEFESNKMALNFIYEKNTKIINLKGTDKNPEAIANVYWNKSQKKFLFKNQNLPNPKDQTQYQLWALVDGKPIDLGVINKDEKSISIKSIDFDKIDSFAITLEKEGGSPTPTLEQLVVIGNISI